MQHRFAVGQLLEMRSSPRLSTRPAGLCEVIACLPHEGGPLLYRVQSRNEANQRVVQEADLTASVAAADDGTDAPATPFSIAINRR